MRDVLLLLIWIALVFILLEIDQTGDKISASIDFQTTMLTDTTEEEYWENSVVLHPDGTYRVWETKDGIIWGYGAIIEPIEPESVLEAY